MVANGTGGSTRGVAAFWMKGLAEAFKDEGLDVVALFREANLDLAALQDPDSRFSPDSVTRLWQLAVKQSGKPTIGLASACVARPALFDIVGYAMMSPPDLRGLLERLGRFHRIVNDCMSLIVTADDEGCRVLVKLPGGETEAVWQQYGFAFMTLLSFIRWVMKRDLRPLAVELTTTHNDEVQPYQNAFGCPVRFGASVNSILFSNSDADLRLPTAQPRLAGVHERVVGEYLARLDRTKTSAQVRAAIPKYLPEGEPRRAAIARGLGVSDRTLQRRLEAEGTSFRRLLDDTRRELARMHFEQGSMSLAHMAHLLGFDDPGSFFRACKRWFGTTPQQYRLRH